MKMPNDMLIGGVDKIDTYLLAWNTHDGSSSFTVAVTPIRVVCQNTLTMAIKKAENSFSLRHTPRVSGKVQAARDTLNLTYRYVEEFEKEAEMLIAQSMTDKEFKLIVEKMIPIDEESERARNLADTARDTMLALWKAPTQLNVAGTKWAAYNAIVEYSDWAKPIRSENPDVKRAEKIVKGQGERFKNRALALLS
jgi:phage/plasmid-like protein (TIGR03299 family)